MTQRLDFARLFVIGLTLISLLTPNYGKEQQPPPSPPSPAPTATPSPTPTSEPTPSPTPTSEPTPSPTRVEPTLRAVPARLSDSPEALAVRNRGLAQVSSQARGKDAIALKGPPDPAATPSRVVPTPTPPKPSPPPGSFHAPPTRLRIPAIGLDAPVITVGFVNSEFEGQPITTWAVPDTLAAGWHHTSEPPGGTGNTVLNGHHDVHGGVFRDLARAQVNDEVVVYAGDTAHRYRIAAQHFLEEEGQSLQVRAQNAQWIMPTEEERLTLVTCAPFPRNTQRLIVVALPVKTEDPRRTTNGEAFSRLAD